MKLEGEGAPQPQHTRTRTGDESAQAICQAGPFDATKPTRAALSRERGDARTLLLDTDYASDVGSCENAELGRTPTLIEVTRNYSSYSQLTVS